MKTKLNHIVTNSTHLLSSKAFNKKYKSVISLLMCVTLVVCLAGCDNSLNSKPANQSKSTSNAKIITSDNIPSQAMNLIESYETLCMGVDILTNKLDFLALGDIGLSYLVGNDMISTYLNDKDEKSSDEPNSYNIPYSVSYNIANFFLRDNTTKFDKNFSKEFITLYDFPNKNAHELILKSGKVLENDYIKLTFSRKIKGKPLNDVTYILKKSIAKNVPSILKDKIAEGDEFYKISAVYNQLVLLNETPHEVKINTVEDLIKLSDDFKENGALCEGNTYLLTNDLDLSNVNFSPIGQNQIFTEYGANGADQSKPGFNAIFDGQGHTISNLNIIKETNTHDDPFFGVGFFSYIGNDGIVKNLNLKNCSVNQKGVYSMRTGILAGVCKGKIFNCNVSGSVFGIGAVGGLVGETYGDVLDMQNIEKNNSVQITNCTAEVNVTGSNATGALLGNTCFSYISNCKASGRVTVANSYREPNITNNPFQVGGYVGYGHFSTFQDCASDVSLNVKDTGSWIGGFAGGMYKSKAINCTYNKEKTAEWEVIDVIDDKNATDYTGYDVKAIE